jgi:hypothetical protein
MSATGRRERSRATRTTCRRCLAFRRDDELAGDALALARAEGTSLEEAVKQALKEAVERRRKNSKFKARVRRLIKEDRALPERLAK